MYIEIMKKLKFYSKSLSLMNVMVDIFNFVISPTIISSLTFEFNMTFIV